MSKGYIQILNAYSALNIQVDIPLFLCYDKTKFEFNQYQKHMKGGKTLDERLRTDG